MSRGVSYALYLITLWSVIRISYLMITGKLKSIFPLAGVRSVDIPRKQKDGTSEFMDSKSEQWYQNLYLQLHNIEDHTEVLGSARDELLAMFSQAIAIGLEQPQGGILSIKQYDPDEIWKFINDEHKIVLTKWQTYLEKRKYGHGPQLFNTIEAARTWLVQHAPVKMVDGAWLAHINKVTTPFPLRSFTKNAWQIFSEELGDGDLSKHHVHLYRQLLLDVGCYLPESHHEDFIQPRYWEGLENKHVWKSAVGQLLISLFPDEFFPEILGFNMHYELVTLETMQAAYELKSLGINPYYFLLHVAIDNADSGHAAIATHVVIGYLDKMRAVGGEAAVTEAWKRVQVGYILSQTLGNPVRPEHRSPMPPFADVPLDSLSVRVSEIFKAKAAVSQQIHCQSGVRLGTRTLTEWLDWRIWMQADKNQQLELLTALTLAKPWVYPGSSSKSLLLRELSWKGRMFGAFTHEETDTLAQWINSLGPNNSAWMYWRFTARKPLDSNDAIARLQDPARFYPSMLPSGDAETLIDLVPIDFHEAGHQGELRTEQAHPAATLTTDRLPDLVALWFAHIALLENTLNIPSRTTTPLYAGLLRLRRAGAGFGLETDIVAGTDEMKRISCPGLVEVGLDLVSRSGWVTNTEFSCIRDILDLTSSHGQSAETAKFVDAMLHWSLRPVKNLGLLLGLSLKFMELKTVMMDSPGLLSLESRVVLEAIVLRERQHLDECVRELRKVDEAQYRNLETGYKVGRFVLETCFSNIDDTETSIHSIPPHLVEQEHSLVEPANFVSEDIDSEFLGDSKSLVPETSSLRGEPWIVKKFGGTSVGRFGVKIAEDIVSASFNFGHRIAIVCSARSTTIKTEGTTTRLMRAVHDALNLNSNGFREIVEEIRLEHLQAGKDSCDVSGSSSNEHIFTEYAHSVNQECQNLLKILEAAQCLRSVTDQTEDMVVLTGEKLSCLYMTALLKTRGVSAVFVDLSEMVTYDTGKGLNESLYHKIGEEIARRVHKLGPDVVPVITGYFGPVPGGLLKQIGRGYTDLCAALTAVGLNARELQVWKEVDGIFTADPCKVPAARLLDSITPSEAAELTFYGSEVIHPFTIDQVNRASIPIRIKNVINPEKHGTIVIPDPKDIGLTSRHSLFRDLSTYSSNLRLESKYPRRPTAVTIKNGITVVNVHSNKRTRAHGFLMSIFKILNDHHLSVDLISASEAHVSMALHSERRPLFNTGEEERHSKSAALQGALVDLAVWGDVDLVPRMAIISLVGRQLKTMIGVSGRFFSTLGEHGINIEMISQGASEINISCVIEEADADRALNVVHANLLG